MRMRALWLAMIVLVPGAGARAFAPDGCEQQRALYPKDWNDVSREKAVFTCSGHGDAVQVRLGATDKAGRTMMSVVPMSRDGKGGLQETEGGGYRIWLDGEQARRLRGGKYFATVVGQEEACWIRGNLEGATVFFMDNAKVRADDPQAAGSFYNKAPRFSVFGNDSYQCEPAK